MPPPGRRADAVPGRGGGPVLVTGGAGLLGAHVVAAVSRAGHATRTLDMRVPESDPRGGEHITASILDLDAVTEACADIDAVLHIAAAANIGSGTPRDIVERNALGGWTVLEAAWRAGVGRVVLCSSDSVLGNTIWPDYFRMPERLPVDEGHAARPTDPYGLSKLMAEQAGRAFAARGRMEVLALRPVFILFPTMMGEVRARARDPDGYRGPSAGGHAPAGGGLCWHHVDPRDVADAFVRALDAPYRGFEAFYLSAPSTLHPTPTLDRVAGRFGGLPDAVDRTWFADNPHAPMFDTRRARDRLGWRARHDHRTALFNAV